MTDRPLKAVLGGHVKDIRLSRGLTQEQLAEAIGVTVRYFAGIERGERNLSLDSVDTLATQLGVPAERLLTSDPEHAREN